MATFSCDDEPSQHDAWRGRYDPDGVLWSAAIVRRERKKRTGTCPSAPAKRRSLKLGRGRALPTSSKLLLVGVLQLQRLDRVGCVQCSLFR